MFTSDLTFLVPPHFSHWLPIMKVGTLIITMMMMIIIIIIIMMMIMMVITIII